MLEESLFLHNICSGFVYKSKEEIKMYLFLFFFFFYFCFLMHVLGFILNISSVHI